ncbi:hypothetical protein H6P81_020019 [Aristolochia fimbriata]|uniref:Fe2OG dioxygenase domain-containing protein n=1 Tax=Aristolochia fimbriata TaxID=158543 RepID=A0AAV7DV71_ARIFI|nr:hypothetical protein H6P81_020019 [Aristolochia fimbriata]
MATDFKSLPIIDVRALLDRFHDPKMAEDKGVIEVVRMLHQACRETGFFYVKGHNIPESLIDEVRYVTHQFFSLPFEEKMKIKMSAETGYRGYQQIGENITNGKPDMHEAVDCYREMEPGAYGDFGRPLEGSNIWPTHPPNFKQLMEEYIGLLIDLSRAIMRGMALALGGPADAFEGKKAGDTFWVLRLIGYPGCTHHKSMEMQDSDIGCGAHTDYGLLTLVNQDPDISALQVRNRSGEWISAMPIPGTFVCNIGDMLKIWTNGLYEPTLHRVINNSSKYRVSIPFFYEPNFDTVVEPFDFCKQKTGKIAKFERVVYGDHLVRKVTTNFVM